MRRIWILVGVVALGGCSSGSADAPAGEDAAAVDAGALDAARDAGAPRDTGSGSGDAGGAEDAPAEASPDAAADTPPEAGADAGDETAADAPPPTDAERWCRSVPSRLEWRGAAGCYDLQLAIACTWRPGNDGRERCFPALALDVAGYMSSACDVRFALLATPSTMTLDPTRPPLVDARDPSGPHACTTHVDTVAYSAGAWWAPPSCTPSTTSFAYVDGAGRSLRCAGIEPDDSFAESATP